MLKQKQLFKHDPERGVHGDCWRTAIASLLELPAEDVPHYSVEGATGEGVINKMDAWLNKAKDMGLFEFPFDGSFDSVCLTMKTYNPGKHYVLTGVGGAGFNHSVVVCDGEVVCDPSGRGDMRLEPIDGRLWVSIVSAHR